MKRVMTFRISDDLLRRLKKVAEEVGAKISQLIIEALKIFLWLYETKNLSVVRRAMEQNSSLITYADFQNLVEKTVTQVIERMAQKGVITVVVNNVEVKNVLSELLKPADLNETDRLLNQAVEQLRQLLKVSREKAMELVQKTYGFSALRKSLEAAAERQPPTNAILYNAVLAALETARLVAERKEPLDKLLKSIRLLANAV